jgi:hypothetical protein
MSFESAVQLARKCGPQMRLRLTPESRVSRVRMRES